MRKNCLLILRIVLYSAIIFTIGVIFWRIIAPNGKVAYVWTPDYQADEIKKLGPNERFAIDGQAGVMRGSPIYFNVRAYRPFNSLTVSIKYKNIDQSPIIETGILVDSVLKNYQLKPLTNTLLDDLVNRNSWNKLEKGKIILLQRKKIYATIEDFLAKPPAGTKIASYNYNWPAQTKLKDYQSPKKILLSGNNLVGAWQAYIYFKNEAANVKIKYYSNSVDLSEVKLLIRDANGKIVETVSAKALNKDQLGANNQQEINLKTNKLIEGLYKIEWQASRNIVAKTIECNSSKFSFISRLELLDQINPIKLWLKSSNVALQTVNPKALQTVRLGGLNLKVEDVYTQYSQAVLCRDRACPLTLTRGGLEVAGHGVIAFSPEAIVAADITPIDYWFKTDKIDYIIANYEPSASDGEWQLAKNSFDLAGIKKNKGYYEVMINVPEMANNNSSGLQISEIKVELEGVSLKQAILNLFK
ncbi:MAG: hypothetical protein PHR00_01415 [Patescibacteria group bacterium]|nr:hypothetical protein [Patescibacteria group bacterium]